MRALSRLKHHAMAAVAATAAAMGSTSYAPPAQAAPLPTLTCTPPAADPEIAALARALQYNLNLIYEYVYYNIDYSPTWGSKKGALGTYLDRRGNGIDQNTLFVELLRQSCISANYRFGALSMPTSEIANNLGVENSSTAVETVLAKGGFSGSVTADVTTVNRVWTEVQLNGVTYELDPSLKSYARYKPIDLGQAMGYSRAGLLSAVTGSSTAVPGAPAGVNTVKGLNRAQLTAQLNTYSGKLADTIKNNYPSASTAQIYGGRVITNDFYGASLPVAGTLYSTLPASFETVYTITVSDNADGSNPSISTTVYASQIASRLLTLTYNAASQPVVTLGGSVLATGAAAKSAVQTVSMTVQHPYPAGNSFSTWGVKPQVKTGGAYALMLVAGELGRDTLTRHQKRIAANLQAGQADLATREALAAIGTAYLSQSDQAAQFSANYFGFVDVRHAAMGIAGKTTAAYVDFPGQTSSISPYSSSMSTDELVAASIGLGIFNSTLESTAVSQLQKGEAVSTVRMFDYNNNDGNGFVEATNANWNQAQSLLTGWSADDKARMAAFLQANGATGRLFIAQNGARKVGTWTGGGWYQFNTTGNVSNMSYLIAGGYFGGYGIPNFSNVTASVYTSPATAQNQMPSPKSGEPVDMYSGAYLYDHADIDVGAGDFPFKLAFKRTYNSNNAANPTTLGNGWRHNFMMSAMIDSDSFLAFGTDNPRAAVPSAVMAYVLKDLVNTATPSLTNTVVASLSASWMMDQLVDNAVTLNLDSGSKKFVKIPTATGYTYVPPPGDASSVVVDQVTKAITLTDKTKNVYSFDGDGQMLSWSDPRSNVVRFAYNGSGPSKTLASVSNNHNAQLQFTYSGNKLVSVSNGSASVSYAYSGDNLSSATDQISNVTRYTYDRDNRLQSIYYPSVPSMAAVTNIYDSLGQMQLQKDAWGNVWNYLFANGQRSTEIDPTGAAWTLYYDKNGNNIEDIDQVGNHTVYAYDGVGRRVRTTYPAGDSVAVVYDANSNVLQKTTYPIPGAIDTITAQPATPLTESWTYDSTFNKPLTEKNARGYVTTNTYDTQGNLVSVTQPAVARPGGATKAPVTTMAYTYGLPKQVVDAEGRVTDYSYDATTLFLLSKAEDAGTGRLNLITRYTYDAVGNQTSVTDPRGNTTTYEYDARRLLTRITPPSPFGTSLTEYRYDADGRQTAEMHGTGQSGDPWRTTKTQYDAAGKVIRVTQPDNLYVITAYDVVGRKSTETSMSGRQVVYTYDPASRITKITDQVSGSLDASITRNLGAVVREQRTYYNTGGLATLTDGKGQTLTYYYDGFKRQKQIVYPDNSYELHGFDEAGNELVTQNRSRQLIWYSYDPLNRMDGKQPDGQAQVTFGYDYTGRRLTANSSAGLNFSYGYDSAGRQISEARSDLGASTWTLDANGNRTKLTWPGSPTYSTSMVYDALNRLTDVYEGNVGGKRLGHYDYNALSQRSASTAGVATSSWDWTNTGQLAFVNHHWTGGFVNFTYYYNYDHQRASTNVSDNSFLPAGLSASAQSYASNTLNQYTNINGVSQLYDTRGNLVGSNGWTYSYDTENHLYRAVKGSTTASYAFDVLGRRASKTVNGVTTHYVSVGDQEIAEYNSAGVLQKRFVYGPGLDEPLAVVDAAGNRQYALTDALGSVIAMVDDSGALKEKYAYTGYGAAISSGANQMPYLFAGRRFDSETELYYNRARVYSPGLGRFMQPDPIGTEGGLNLYAYVLNDPLTNTDPLGTTIWSGTYYAVSGSLLGVSGTHYRFELTSQVVDGKFAMVVVTANAAGIGVSLPYGATGGSITFDDHQTSLNPETFNGGFSATSFGLSAFVGGGYSSIVMGNGTSSGWGLEMGIDAGGGYVAGKAQVQSALVTSWK